jgi:hypothetical protein
LDRLDISVKDIGVMGGPFLQTIDGWKHS